MLCLCGRLVDGRGCQRVVDEPTRLSSLRSMTIVRLGRNRVGLGIELWSLRG